MKLKDIKLTLQERGDRTWAMVEEALKEELDTLRRKNDGDLDERATAKLRGRIAQIKEVLAIAGVESVDRTQ